MNHSNAFVDAWGRIVGEIVYVVVSSVFLIVSNVTILMSVTIVLDDMVFVLEMTSVSRRDVMDKFLKRCSDVGVWFS